MRNNPCRSLSDPSSLVAKAGSNDVSRNDEEVIEERKSTRKGSDKPRKPDLRRKPNPGKGEVLSEVLEGNLPPLDMWRKYFPMEKASVRRCAVRKPETAAMLAEAFVPEGSKDKIIIEASPGM